MGGRAGRAERERLSDVGGAVPTLSQVQAWDVDHLTGAATHWSQTATVWEDHVTSLSRQIGTPGGMPWMGEAADAAQQRAHTDRLTVVGMADQLHNASAIARSGAGEVSAARNAVLDAVSEARDAGFTVGEDFSVTSHEHRSQAYLAGRQAQAEGLAAAIHAKVVELVATDGRVATKITAAADGLGATSFPESGDSGESGRSAGPDSDVMSAIGDTIEKGADKGKDLAHIAARTADSADDARTAGRLADDLEFASTRFGKLFGGIGYAAQGLTAYSDYEAERAAGTPKVDALVDVGSKTAGSVGGGMVGASIGAEYGAGIGLVFGGPVGMAVGAGLGAAIGGFAGSEAGQVVGETLGKGVNGVRHWVSSVSG